MKTASLTALALTVAFAGAIGLTAPRSQEEGVPADSRMADLISIGEPIYAARCRECHGSAGGGFIGPKFVGNDRIANADLVIRQINGGGADMPAFRNKLTEDEILAVGTYIRNSWGNSYGALP